MKTNPDETVFIRDHADVFESGFSWDGKKPREVWSVDCYNEQIPTIEFSYGNGTSRLDALKFAARYAHGLATAIGCKDIVRSILIPADDEMHDDIECLPCGIDGLT